VIKGTVAIAQRALSSADAASTAAQQALSSADAASTAAQQALSSADAASGVAQQAFADSRLTRELIANVEAALQHYQHLTAITEQRVNDLLNSTSWRVTAPLRWLSTALRKLLGVPWRVFRFGVRALMLPVMRFVLARPSLRQALRSALKRFPSVAHRLHLLAIHRGLVPAPATPSPVPPTPAAEPGPPLTPPAKRIYDELKKAIEQRNKETQNP
jgi:O-antigen chain-terminating methyltransferase